MENKQVNHKIGAITATIISMNAMIGAGIFTTPAKLATSVGPAGIITFIFVIIAVLFMALSVARVAQYYPEEGSFYAYAKQWGGHTIGVIAAISYIAGIVIALGLLTKVTVNYLSAYTDINPNLLGLLLVSSIVILNLIGVKFMQIGQIFLLSCTLFALIATIIFGFSHANLNNFVPFMPYGAASLVYAIPTIIFGFFGFEAAASLFAIVKNPQRNVPRALTLSVLIVGTMYLAFILAIMLSIPSAVFTDPNMTISQALIKAYPNYKWLAYAIGGAILTALLGVLQSLMYSISVLTFSFLKFLHSIYAQSFLKSPYALKAVIIAIGAITLFNFFTIKNINIFFDFTALFAVSAYTLSMLTLLIKKHDKTIVQKGITIAGLITAGIIFLSALIDLAPKLINLF